MMSGSEDEPYSTMFASLKHPVRRKLLRMLSEKPRSFSQMLEASEVSSSHLTYHLESLGELVSKTDDGKYKLSAFGEAAVATMSRVEETPKATQPKRLSTLSIKWKSLFVALVIGLVILAGVSYIQYRSMNQISGEYSQLEKLVDLVKNGASFQTMYDLSYGYTTATVIINDSTATIDVGSLQGPSYGAVYSLHGDSTLDLFLSTHSLSAGSHISLVVQKGNVFDLGTNETAPVIWSINATETGTRMYSISLASEGWYTISLAGPITEEISLNSYAFQEVNCTASLIIMHEGTVSPFVIVTSPLS
jgi:DNA-binding transcriptional ArsR family regulator